MDRSFYKETLDTRNLKELAIAFGLPCIEEKNGLISVVGETNVLLFKQEDTQCQLIKIY